MKPIFQTIIDPKEGNCLQACIASLFEVEIEKIPHIPPKDGRQLRDYREWLLSFGYTMIVLPVDQPKGMRVAAGLPIGMLMMVSGKSGKFSNGNHVVVGRISDGLGSYEIAHDPNPEATGISTPYYYYFFAPISPSVLSLRKENQDEK